MTQIKIGAVQSLWRYPVSSVGGERLARLQFTEAGAVGDRLFGIFDDETHDVIYPSRFKHWNLAPMLSARLDGENHLFLSMDGTAWSRADDPLLRKALSSFFGRSVSVHKYGTELQSKAAVSRYKHSPIHLLSRQAIE